MLLRFELVSNSNYTAIAEYIDFKLGDESSDYMATFGPAVLRSGILKVCLHVTKLTAEIFLMLVNVLILDYTND